MDDGIDEETTGRLVPPALSVADPVMPAAPAALHADPAPSHQGHPPGTVTVSRSIASLALVGAFIVGALLTGGVGAGIAVASATQPHPKPTTTYSAAHAIEVALSNCTLSDTANGITVSDGGKTLSLDGAGEADFEGLQPDAEICVLQKLGATSAVIDNMEGTRALDGTQTGSWPHFSASWRYHPDDGLDVIVTATK